MKGDGPDDVSGDAIAWAARGTEDTPCTLSARRRLVPDEAGKRPRDWEHKRASDGRGGGSVDQLGHGGID